MKFKLDENFGPTVPVVFRQRGHDCQTVHQERLTGADDAAVLAAAVGEQRILVTMDHDFGNVLAYPAEATTGVAVINPPGRVSRPLLMSLLESLLVACEGGQLQGKLWIVEPGRIREHRDFRDSELE